MQCGELKGYTYEGGVTDVTYFCLITVFYLYVCYCYRLVVIVVIVVLISVIIAVVVVIVFVVPVLLFTCYDYCDVFLLWTSCLFF